MINPSKKMTYIAPNNEVENNSSESMSSGCTTNYKECSCCDFKNYCSGIWVSTYEIEKDKSKIIRQIKKIEEEK